MRKLVRKITYWSIIIAAYVLMWALVSFPLFELETELFPDSHKHSAVVSAELDEPVNVAEVLEQATDYSKVLLPLAPGEGRLPGRQEIWSEFFSSERGHAGQTNVNDFDGIQVTIRAEDFFEDAIAEIFLSGEPLQSFRRGHSILLLNNSGVVQIIDCTKTHQPRLSGVLPYQRVKFMQMQGNIAFLLIDVGGGHKTRLVVTDLSSPLKPRLISQHDLADQVESFILFDHQLIFYANTKGFKKSLSVHLYNLTEDFQLVHLGQGRAPEVGAFVQFESYLLTAGLRSGLNIIDFSEPLQPTVIAKVDLPDQVKKIVRNGEKVYALGENHKLYDIDIQDPANPTVSDVMEGANHSAVFLAFAEHIYLLTKNGYLRAFERPDENSSFARSGQAGGFFGELLANRSVGGFTLLGETERPLPVAVTDVKSLPRETKINDTLLWQGYLIVLGDDGLVQFFLEDHEGSLQLDAELRLSSTQRWLAASSRRLYVGGEQKIDVIAINDVEGFAVTGQLEFSAQESWDGLIVGSALCVAAGEQGILCFSGEDPDLLEERSSWTLPEPLESQLDVRILANAGDNRLFAAAGPVGVVGGRIIDGGGFKVEGLIDFPEPIQTLAVVDGFCLVSTGRNVEVIDIRHSGFLQNLGEIDFPGVTRFAVAQSGAWAGYVPESGWSISPAPYLLSLEDIDQLGSAASIMGESKSMGRQYQLKLFNDTDVINVPGVVSLSPDSGDMVLGGSRAF